MNDFFEKTYYFELERKDKLVTAVSFPIGLSAISASLINYAIEKGPIDLPFSGIIIALIFFAAIAIALIIAYGIRFFVTFEYKYIGKSEKFSDWMEDLVRHKTEFPGAEDPLATFNIGLAKSFAKSADHNATNNDQRSSLLFMMNAFAAASLVFSICGSGIVALGNHSSSNATEVKIYG